MTFMTRWLRKPLSRGEIVGYLVFIGGFALLQVRGGFRDPLVELAVLIMAAGMVIAARGGGPESP